MYRITTTGLPTIVRFAEYYGSKANSSSLRSSSFGDICSENITRDFAETLRSFPNHSLRSRLRKIPEVIFSIFLGAYSNLFNNSNTFYITMSEIEEASKAVAETAKFGTKSVEVTNKILGFISKIINEPLEQTSGIIGDKLKFIRWKRQVRMVDEVNKNLCDRNIQETKPIPLKFAIPMIESASLEENDELQDLWNKLIANSMNPKFTGEIRYAYIEIIKNLTSLDVKILDKMYQELVKQKCDLNLITNYSFTKEQIAQMVQCDMNECIMSIYNLFRVQCLSSAVFKFTGIKSAKATSGNESPTVFKGVDQVTMTPFGKSFIEACIN